MSEAVEQHVGNSDAPASISISESRLPEFVSAENFSDFVQASRESDSVPHDQGRLAAEMLIARIASAATTSDREFLHGVVEAKNPEQAPGADAAQASSGDPPTDATVATVATAEPTTFAAAVVPVAPANEAILSSVAVDPEGPADDGARDSDPKKPASVAAIAQPTASDESRVDPVTASAGPRRFSIVSKRSTASVVRVKRKKVASAGSNDANDSKWGSPSGLLRGATPPAEAHSDDRAFGGPTQSMAPLIAGCGHMTAACKANQSWCGC